MLDSDRLVADRRARLPLERIVGGTGVVVVAVVAVTWVVCLARLLRHRIFISHDTLINYAHVWFISDRLWHGHGVPFRMPGLEHGHAFAFPYGFAPWITAAVFRPLAGDRIVTIWLAVGAVGLAVSTFLAFPELRRGWVAAAVLLNPAFVTAPVSGQLPFLWASALLLGGVACWRRERRGWATVLTGLAQITHPAVVAPIAAVLVAARLPFERDRRSLLAHYGVSVLAAVPAGLLVIRSPVFVESSLWVKGYNFVGTIVPRSLVVAIPVGLLLLFRRSRPLWVGPLVVLVMFMANVVSWTPFGTEWAWRGFHRRPDTAMVAFVHSTAFVPHRTFRLLRAGDAKVGMYQLLQGGARLDSEFFPESMLHRSWPSAAAYSAVLRSRDVDYVMAWRGYAGRNHVNEVALLDRLARRGRHDCNGPIVCVRAAATTHAYVLYEVRRSA